MGIYCVELLLEVFGDPKSISLNCKKLSNEFMASGKIVAFYDEFKATLLFSKVEDISVSGEIVFKSARVNIDNCANLSNIFIVNQDGKHSYLKFNGSD